MKASGMQQKVSSLGWSPMSDRKRPLSEHRVEIIAQYSEHYVKIEDIYCRFAKNLHKLVTRRYSCIQNKA